MRDCTTQLPNLLSLPNGCTIGLRGSMGTYIGVDLSLIDEKGKETVLCSVDYQYGKLVISVYEDDKTSPSYTKNIQLSNTGGEKPQGKDF